METPNTFPHVPPCSPMQISRAAPRLLTWIRGSGRGGGRMQEEKGGISLALISFTLCICKMGVLIPIRVLGR